MSRSKILKDQFNELVTSDKAELALSASTETANNTACELINSLKMDLNQKKVQLQELEADLQHLVDQKAKIPEDFDPNQSWGDFVQGLSQNAAALFLETNPLERMENIVNALTEEGNDKNEQLIQGWRLKL